MLKHEWRLLLPERNRYRYASGDLRPVRGAASNVPGGLEFGVEGGVPGGVVGGVVGGLPDAPAATGAGTRNIAMGTGGTAELRGNVLDANGDVIPGADVRLTDEATGRELGVVTDANGEFRFAGLAGGTYKVRADLAGSSPRSTARSVSCTARRARSA